MTQATAAQIAYGVSFEDYRKIKALNATALKAGRRSLAHLRHAVTGGDTPETPSMRIGSAAHCLILEPEKFDACFFVYKSADRRTKAGQNAYTQIVEAAAGRTLINDTEMAACRAIADAVRKHPAAGPFIGAPGICEAVATWTDEETGILCKARFDKYAAGALALDIKTTRDASGRAFARQCATLGYAQQVAWYEEGFRAVTGTHTQCVLIAVESEPPHAVGFYTIDERSIADATAINRQIVRAVRHAMTTGEWPAYSPGVVSIEVPDWAFTPCGALPCDGDDDHPF